MCLWGHNRVSQIDVAEAVFRPVLIVVIWLLLTQGAFAASPGDTSFSPQVARWEMQEIALKSTRSYANPFKDVNLKCRFKSGATEVVAEGFYDGGNTWKVRLMPTVEGTWSFETTSNDPELNDQKGSFKCTPARAGVHGPIVVRNKYHFAYADGTPYFPLGTTLYNWVHRETELQERTLATLKKSPFNKIRFCVFPLWYQFNRVEPPLYPYVMTGENQFDFERFNPEYFQHIEKRLRDLQALDIQGEIILFHPYDKWGYATMDQAHDDAYLHYVIARLASFHNVWWTMANEWDFMKPGKNWDHVFQVVQAADPYNHLRSNHNGHIWYDHSKPWVTHCNIQEQGRGEGRLYQVAFEARSKYGKPIIVEEYSYEGNMLSRACDCTGLEETMRHWEVTMAGGYGSHGETYVHPGDIVWWSHGGELVGESPARLGFLKKIMTSLPYEQMEPLPEIAWRSRGVSALGKRGECYLFQLDKGIPWREIEIELPRSGPFKVELIDPWLMQIHPLGAVRGGKHKFVPKFVPSLMRVTQYAAGDPAAPTPGSEKTIRELLDDAWSR